MATTASPRRRLSNPQTKFPHHHHALRSRRRQQTDQHRVPLLRPPARPAHHGNSAQPQLQPRRHVSEPPVRGTAGNAARPKRKMRIILSYTARAKDSHAQLNRWLDRFDDPGRRGRDIDIEYAGDGTYKNGGYKQRPRRRAGASKRANQEAGRKWDRHW